jgi:secondary thiamine-phosphate synthase enzyme
MVRHIHLQLEPRTRGFHLITDDILSALPAEWPSNGLLHVFIQHTSAGICINENADATVLTDFEMAFNRMVPEQGWPYSHTVEGPDDMPAHIKSVFCGSSITVPLVNGSIALGEWQGVYLCEFRNHGAGRKLVISLLG